MANTATLRVASTADQFDAVYAEAAGDRSRIPWDDGGPHAALVNWLNAVAPSLVRCGARVACVGCGLGEDARELMRRGYDVSAFDCSATAIEWARRLDPDNAACYHQADLFEIPERWRHRFDLVVEVNTVQAIPPDQHAAAFRAIADLVSPHGHLLVCCRGADDPPAMEDGPPWPLTQLELERAAGNAGLQIDGEIAAFLDSAKPGIRRLRALFRRS
jgi:2-polyprenyl-3-methyl-5-hydroxy-6-metoxy-1,4-benzoquinol methylase